jgi:hypothetical protein
MPYHRIGFHTNWLDEGIGDHKIPERASSPFKLAGNASEDPQAAIPPDTNKIIGTGLLTIGTRPKSAGNSTASSEHRRENRRTCRRVWMEESD